MSDRLNSAPVPAVNTTQLYDSWLAEEQSDDKGLRWSLAVAAVLHGLLLIATVPAITEAEVAKAEKPKVYKMPQVPRFEPPPKTEMQPRQIKQTKVIPDFDYEGPDIYVSDEDLIEPAIVMQDSPDLVGWIPDAPPAPKPTGPLQVGGDVSAPVRLSGPQPQYTEIARKARIEGAIVLRSVILRDGSVDQVEVLKGLPMGLSEEAIKAIRQWRFEPGTLQGKPVDVVYHLTVQFRLQ